MNELPMKSQLQVRIAQYSAAGVKPDNEDAIGIRIPEGTLLTTKGIAAVIADGVSAAEAGKEASEICVQNFLSDYYSTPESWSVEKSVQQVLTALNRWLYSRSCKFNQVQKGYVSTLSVLIVKSSTAHIFHVGDSRIALWRNGQFEYLTRDHAMAISNNNTYLTRAMGLDTRLDVDYRKLSVQKGDCFLMTTDGIHDVLPVSEIVSVCADVGVSANKDELDDAGFETLARCLADKALVADSRDNVSAQLLQLQHLADQQAEDVYQALSDLPFPPFLEEGMTLDGYKILREIHASNRSQLYVVEETSTAKRYCMKTPSLNFEDDAAYIERFIMESWIGKRIDNAHVVKVIEPQHTKSCLYYLTEYIDGMTLGQWIKENPQPAVQEVVYLLEQVGKGLRALHRRETLHQDIKPDNVVIDRDGLVKIIDFGSCSVRGINEIAVPITRDIALGTVSYSAPEYTVRKKASETADIFSLAVVAYEMLTGELPFEGKLEDCKTPEDFLKTRYIPSYALNPHVPLWVDGALRKALRYHPERRYQEVSEFIYDLQHPNPEFLNRGFQPLLDKNPLLFWQCMSLFWFLVAVALVVWAI